jgi:hypothetical protein
MARNRAAAASPRWRSFSHFAKQVSGESYPNSR